MFSIGEVSSDAFLEYIREQVENFTVDVSRKMLKHESFLNLREENSQHISSESNQEDDSAQNENGPVDVPFTVRFNDLALSDTIEQ